MTGSVIGEFTDEFVTEQVKIRQKTYGRGLAKLQRTPQDIQFMNNRNAWIKMASSVSVKDVNLRIPFETGNVSAFGGSNLAKKAILFNGLSSFDGSKLNMRAGANVGAQAVLPSTSYFNNSAYGLGGNDFGILPMPGISSVSIDTKNRGSIKTATIQIMAFNKYQFDIIETLYCRLGFSMLIEWGWDKYIDNNGDYRTVGSTVLEDNFFTSSNQNSIISAISKKTEKYHGNTGGLFGKVVNFNWKYNSDGSYSITVKITGLGDVIESMKINQSPSLALKDSLQNLSHDRYKLLREAKSSIDTNKTVTKLGTILYKQLNTQSLWSNGGNGDYFNLFLALKNSSYSSFLGNDGTDGIKIEYNYFIRFGELLRIIDENITPDINSNSNIKFTNFDKNTDKVICSIQPNLISFDPAISIIKMDTSGQTINQNDISGITLPTYTKTLKEFTNILGTPNNTPTTPPFEITISTVAGTTTTTYTVRSFSTFNQYNKTFENPSGTYIPIGGYDKFVSEVNTGGSTSVAGNMMYGKILNIYLNYDMIFNVLSKNVDKKGNLTFFKFLQSICDNINSSFANIVDIEPIIKNDKTITFMDAKPIQGLGSKLSSLLPSMPTKTAEFEVVGFNLDSLTDPQGTFLKNISFNTKFSPKLASQLSIGATAGGIAMGQDATGLSKWNSGLVDRYQVTIEDPVVATTVNINTGNNTGNNNTQSTGKPYQGGNPFLEGLLVPTDGTILNHTPGVFDNGGLAVDLGFPLEQEVYIDGTDRITRQRPGQINIIIYINKDGQIISSNFDNPTGALVGPNSTQQITIDYGGIGRIPWKQETLNLAQLSTALSAGVTPFNFQGGSSAISFNDLSTIVPQSGSLQGTINNNYSANSTEARTYYLNFDINNLDSEQRLNNYTQNFLDQTINGFDRSTHIYNRIVEEMCKAYGVPVPTFSNPSFTNSSRTEGIQGSNNFILPTYTITANSGTAGSSNTNTGATAVAASRARKLAGANYSAYLAQMFGGSVVISPQLQQSLNVTVQPVQIKDSEYTFRPNVSSFSKAGKSSYKIYLDEQNKKAAAANPNNIPASNQIGLLPIEFDMEMEGIAGFRIYNKIDINQRFLPSNYANSLKFLIKGINHKIDGSGWTTNLQTLSTSNLNARPVTKNAPGSSSRRTTNITSPQVQALISANPVPSATAYSGDPRLQPIKDMIALHESSQKYDIANQGSRGSYNLTKATIPDNTVVVGKTMVELLDQRSTTFSNCLVPICTFAMGRYQIIPATLKSLLRSTTGVSATSLFSPANQEKLCDTLLFNSRPNIGKYIDGTVPGTKQELSKAVQSLAQEWASMPATIKDKLGNTNVGDVASGAGNTGYYQGTVNRSTTSETVGDIVKALIETRRLYLAGQSNQEPSFVPSYV